MSYKGPNEQATVLCYRLKYKTNNKLLATDYYERNSPRVSIKFSTVLAAVYLITFEKETVYRASMFLHL